MRIGCYAGSFNPFHLGHLDIYKQAQKQFDLVVLAVGCNPDKKDNDIDHALPKFSNDIEVISKYDGFLSDELKQWVKNGKGAPNDVTLVRGLRNIYDLNAEQNMLAFVKEMYPELKVVFFLSDPKYQHISSTALRNIRKFSEKEYKKWLVPPIDIVEGEGFTMKDTNTTYE